MGLFPVIDSFRGEHFFLSNFYVEKPIKFGSIWWMSAEHIYQAHKANTIRERDLVRSCLTPGQTKRIVRGFAKKPLWDSKRVDIMRNVLKAKFVGDMAVRLLGTGSAELIEGNNWGDRFWGKVNGHGENMLGKLLMEIRDEI